MHIKKIGLVIIMAVLVQTARAGLEEMVLQTEFITMNNIDRMTATQYTPQNNYTYRFVNGASDISDGSDFEAVRNAFGTWVNVPTAGLRVSEVIGKAGFTPGSINGANDISWIDSGYGYDDPWTDLLGLSNNAIAVVMTWYSPNSGTVLERDMYFNDINFDWRTDSDGLQSGGFYVEHIALHEVGHIYGLKDVYNPPQSGWENWMGGGNEDLTMYGYSSWRNEDTTLSYIDIAAISSLHAVAVPEPDSAILFVLAGGVLVTVRRR
ncbi:MAG: PEP-CTERM sorting domain-containing protein [Deltaproteobacteria bacterium]|nr:PEP-CTERM sorting domain-containing protein [Deltaproteobacteria bacterium]